MPLPAPTLTNPLDGALGVYSKYNIGLSWTGVTGAVKYRLQIARDAALTDLIYDHNDLTNLTASVPWNTFAFNTQYYWRAAAIDSGDVQGDWSVARSFVYGLDGSVLVYGQRPDPDLGWHYSSVVQRFQWGPVPYADYYKFQVATDANFVNLVVNIPSTIDVFYQTPGGILNAGTVYYARVMAYTNAGNYSAWSTLFASWKFRTCTSPNPPLTPKPGNGAQLAYVRFTLSWDNQSELPSGYDLQVATDSNFANLVVDVPGLRCNSYYLDSLDVSALYYWRVRTTNPSGTSAWSQTWGFRTGASGQFPADVNGVAETLAPIAGLPLPDSPQGYHTGMLHGTLFRNGYLYGSSRGQNSLGSMPGNIAKIAQDLSYAIAVTPVGTDGQLGSNYDDLRDDGTNLHTFGYNGHLVVDPDTLAVAAAPSSYNNTFEVDGTYLYAPGAFQLNKFLLSDWSNAGYRVISEYNAALRYDGSKSGSLPHSNLLDTDGRYWWIQIPEATACLMKVDRTTLEVVAVTNMIPQTTDDMTQDENYVYLGTEQAYNGTTLQFNYGYDIGAIAVRKSDLAVFLLPKLGVADTESVVSYSSTMLGNYLFDCKTNAHIYVLDVTDPTNWAKNLPLSQVLLADYDYGSVVGGQHIVNEIVVDGEGKLLGTTWENPGMAYRFDITRFALIAPPIINTLAASNVTKVGATLTGYVARSGGGTISARGFDWGTDPDNLDQSVEAVAIGSNFRVNVPLVAGTTYYFRAWAENQAGRGTGTVVSVQAPAAGTTYVVEGVAELDNQLVAGAVVYLIDELTGSVVQATASSDAWGFVFFNLSSSHSYTVAGWYKTAGGQAYNAFSYPNLTPVPK